MDLLNSNILLELIKNHELSDILTNDNDPKMQREGSSNDSQNVDNIFAEGLSSSDCVAILVNCIKNVEKQIVEILSKTEETKNSQIKAEQHLMELNETVTLISEQLDKYERDQIIKEMQKELQDVPSTIQLFKVNLDRQVQYFRRNFLKKLIKLLLTFIACTG